MNQIAGSELYIGLMSGTSLDGVDVAIVDFSQFPPDILDCRTRPYPSTIRKRLQRLCQTATTTLDDLYGMDAELGELFAESVNQALAITALDRSKIEAIGCHGQTIRHRPDSAIPFTVQIGDPNRIAVLTGITTVTDFRRKDIALGGQAAPLAPAFHQFLFRSKTEDRALINIGGIANITYLPADPGQPVVGFDTGPGNTLSDYWNSLHHASAYDDAGNWARSGQLLGDMLEAMISQEAYFRRDAPKTTGTEFFNSDWLSKFLPDAYAKADVQATLVELTAITIASAVSALPSMPENCFVCGGGAHNHYLLERLAQNLPECSLATTDKLGLDPDYVEAVAFAWQARERINLRSGNIPEVTRAKQAAILGGVYVPG